MQEEVELGGEQAQKQYQLGKSGRMDSLNSCPPGWLFYACTAMGCSNCHHHAVVVAWQLWGGMVPRAVAYVSLDLNPSLELGLDRKNIIVSAAGLNKQGDDLLAACPVISMTMEDGINEIIGATVAAGYFSKERNFVVYTVTVTGSRGSISEGLVTQVIEGSLARSRVQAEVLVQDVGVELREAARQQGACSGTLSGPAKRRITGCHGNGGAVGGHGRGTRCKASKRSQAEKGARKSASQKLS